MLTCSCKKTKLSTEETVNTAHENNGNKILIKHILMPLVKEWYE